MNETLSLNPPIREFRLVTYTQTAMYGGDRQTITHLVHVSILDRYVAWLIEEHQPTEDFHYRIESICVQEPTHVLDHNTWAEGVSTFEWGEKRFVFQRSSSTASDATHA